MAEIDAGFIAWVRVIFWFQMILLFVLVSAPMVTSALASIRSARQAARAAKAQHDAHMEAYDAFYRGSISKHYPPMGNKT
jgi:hypothetical protein